MGFSSEMVGIFLLNHEEFLEWNDVRNYASKYKDAL